MEDNAFCLPSSSTPASKLYVVKFSRGDGSATTSTHTFRTSRAKLIRWTHCCCAYGVFCLRSLEFARGNWICAVWTLFGRVGALTAGARAKWTFCSSVKKVQRRHKSETGVTVTVCCEPIIVSVWQACGQACCRARGNAAPGIQQESKLCASH